MLVVIDTNVLLSALWSKNGTCAQFLACVFNYSLTPCFDSRMITEYRDVLSRPKFKFTHSEIMVLLKFIQSEGFSVVPEPSPIFFVDNSDKKFYEVAKHCKAILITGNTKHFPQEHFIMNVHQFFEKYPKFCG